MLMEAMKRNKALPSPRAEYWTINGRKVDQWRYNLNKNSGLYQDSSSKGYSTPPKLYSLDSTIQSMAERLAKIRNINKTPDISKAFNANISMKSQRENLSSISWFSKRDKIVSSRIKSIKKLKQIFAR